MRSTPDKGMVQRCLSKYYCIVRLGDGCTLMRTRIGIIEPVFRTKTAILFWNHIVLKKFLRYKENMRSCYVFIVLCLAVVMVTATQDGRRRLPDQPTTEGDIEVSSQKCEDTPDFCGAGARRRRSLGSRLISSHILDMDDN
ncbi:hypothetical protein evm_008684 [Chilo suppressalis]|nr:hypothetical protein evm_008684 [Chilo suppressalis]